MTKAAEAVIAELKEYYGKKKDTVAPESELLRVFQGAEVINLYMHFPLRMLNFIYESGNKGIINEEAVILSVLEALDAALEEILDVREILQKHVPAKSGGEDANL